MGIKIFNDLFTFSKKELDMNKIVYFDVQDYEKEFSARYFEKI